MQTAPTAGPIYPDLNRMFNRSAIFPAWGALGSSAQCSLRRQARIRWAEGSARRRGISKQNAGIGWHKWCFYHGANQPEAYGHATRV